MKYKGFASIRDWLIAVILGCGLVLIPYLVHAEMRYFAVTAYNDFGESAYSVEVSRDLNKGESITLQWNEIARADGYRLYWGKEPRVYRPGINTLDSTTHTIIQLDAPTVTIIGD